MANNAIAPGGGARRPNQEPSSRRRWFTPTTVLLTLVLALVGAGWVVAMVREPRLEANLQAAAPPASVEVVRDSSHRLSTAPDGKVTFVEFLDFECESCRAVYPTIEQLRAQYAGRVTFVIRYFPLDGHYNAMRAARAVEAAAQQGQLETMYKKMYDTQTEWGEQQTPADDTFRTFAADLGLDMARWSAAYEDPATVDRIQVDVADGTALGVQGTPAFFLNGDRIEPRSVAELTSAIDEAVAR